MARVAVLCVLFAVLAISVYGQSAGCGGASGDFFDSTGKLVIDASGVTNLLSGTITIAHGSSKGVVLDFKTGGTLRVDSKVVGSGLLKLSTIPTAAPRVGGANFLVAVALGALALLSQRGSLAALAIVLAVASVAIAACTGDNKSIEVAVTYTNEVTSIDVKVKAPSTGSCPSPDLGELKINADLGAVTVAQSGKECIYTWTNPTSGCSDACALSDGVSNATCASGTCSVTCTDPATTFTCAGDTSCTAFSPSTCGCGETSDCTTSVLHSSGVECNAGECTYTGECSAGWSDCDGDLTNGCEANILNNSLNCGGCHTAENPTSCSLLPGVRPDATVTCSSGECQLSPADCDATHQFCAGTCSLLIDDVANCGRCNNDCNSGENVVAGGTCALVDGAYTCDYNCAPNTDACDPTITGCVSLDSVEFCGSCSKSCSGLPNVDGVECISGACNITLCSQGWSNCDDDADNGCEAYTANDTLNCGGCDFSCASLPNLDPNSLVCVEGVCNGTCADGYAYCLGTEDPAGVGCPDSVTGPTACGGCGINCNTIIGATANGITCNANVECDYDECATGFSDCDLNRANGCELSTSSNLERCGGCANDIVNNCTLWGISVNAAPACQNSVCIISSCLAGYDNCDPDQSNGCETSLTDPQSCGSCTNDCTTGTVVNVQSVICATSPTVGCDFTSCDDNFFSCDGIRSNGCEINGNTDKFNCGGCASTSQNFNCTALPHVTSAITCQAGQCSPYNACASGFFDCDGLVANGCETPAGTCEYVAGQPGCMLAKNQFGSGITQDCSEYLTKPNVAGVSCARVDDPANGVVAGSCVLSCSGAFRDCDGDPDNGCEAVPSMCSADLTGSVCATAKQDVSGQDVNCLLLGQSPLSDGVVFDPAVPCNSDTGKCEYSCKSNFVDCDGSGRNGCEADLLRCPLFNQDGYECVFTHDDQCGPECVNCLTLSGTVGGTTCNAATMQCNLTPDLCAPGLCSDADGDPQNGCEVALGYQVITGVGLVDCSKDIDLTNVNVYGPITCIGDAEDPDKGRCNFVCKDGFRDCDQNPLNGCESAVGPDATCHSCVYAADTQCGQNKCVDCTTLDGTLGVVYANSRWASASASTCYQVDLTVDARLSEFACDTSVHYLNPRFDPPNGHNGACQSELCRDVDGNWENGCESAQQYGRGRFYYYGDEYNTDVFLVPYVPNPYEARFHEYKREFFQLNNVKTQNIVNEIKFLNYVVNEEFQATFSDANSGFNNLLNIPTPDSFYYDQIIGRVSSFHAYEFYDDASGVVESKSLAADNNTNSNIYLSTRDFVLLHYTVSSFEELDDPAEAAQVVLRKGPYKNPQDCVLSEWSTWGPCTFGDSCIDDDYWLQTRIRTRTVITPASGGGVCHLPLVEDFYRFMHRSSNENVYAASNGNYTLSSGMSGSDYQHGGGLGSIYDYTGSSFRPTDSSVAILYWNPVEWDITDTTLHNFVTQNSPRDLTWTGGIVSDVADLAPVNSMDVFGRLMTCVVPNTCGYSNYSVQNCTLSAWSEWSPCSAACDGDWAGGVRIRTREVIAPAYSNGRCFVDEFDANGVPLVPNAGMLYEEDWQCNDFSCSSFDCTVLRNSTFVQLNNLHIDLSPAAILPVCDGQDWPEYVNGNVFIDANRDGWDDNTIWVNNIGEDRRLPFDGNFNLFETIYEFTYDYRWPGHCLYDCEEGWYDCDHIPDNGCETDGDFCSIADYYGTRAQLQHPILPWVHPHGDCTVAWSNSTRQTDCLDDTDPLLRFTAGVCIYDVQDPMYGECDVSCQYGYANCLGTGCVNVQPFGSDYCGSRCTNCNQLSRFGYGLKKSGGSDRWKCAINADEDDWECRPDASVYPNCLDNDNDLSNGYETAVYRQWPYPDVETHDVQMEEWSQWTICSHADNCGFLWDIAHNVFRNVPLQTRYRRPLASAYNGGFYHEFSYLPYDQLIIDGVEFPPISSFAVEANGVTRIGILGTTPSLQDIRGIPLVQTPFYEVRVCAEDQPISECIECTNQLEGLEIHCSLTGWSDWSACNAECIDRIHDPEYSYYKEWPAKGTYGDNNYLNKEIELTEYWVTDRVPYQIRTRSVISSAANGGRCPPPGDTWKDRDIAFNVKVRYGDSSDLVDTFDYAVGGSDVPSNNKGLTALASYLVEVRKCNDIECQYYEDCDALNYWYPGHFKGLSTCVGTTTWFGSYPGNSQSSGSAQDVLSLCYTDDISVDVHVGCNVNNGYCRDQSVDLRNGCDTYVYADHCGRTQTSDEWNEDVCDYTYFRNCTSLPGVRTPFAAPCINDEDPSADDSSSHAHRCDIRWACEPSLCKDGLDHYFTDISDSWLDGCETATNYQYPFVTVESKVPFEVAVIDDNFDPVVPYDANFGNPLSMFYEWATEYTYDFDDDGDFDNDEADINYVTFYDPWDIYNLSKPSNNSQSFSFDCQYFLTDEDVDWDVEKADGSGVTPVEIHFCGADSLRNQVQFIPATVSSEDDSNFYGTYVSNRGCHIHGAYDVSIDGNEYIYLGFGCNGDWNKPNAGICTFVCEDGYFDADLDPRNGCETDINQDASPDDKYIWVGNCKLNATSGLVPIAVNSSCGADQCVNCHTLPGINTAIPLPSCELVEEVAGKIPVLGYSDKYYAIQYACSVKDKTEVYPGYIDFIGDQNNFCNGLCYDGDNDWTNGCEQGRGYSTATYTQGRTYDLMYDFFHYELEPELMEGADDDLLSSYEYPSTTVIADTNDIFDGHRTADFTSDAVDRPNKKSSGFENPIPGAWFYLDYTSQQSTDPYLRTLTMPAFRLTEFLQIYHDDVIPTLAVDVDPLPPLNLTSKRAFDCSLLYSTELLYTADGVYVGIGSNKIHQPTIPDGTTLGTASLRTTDDIEEAVYTFADMYNIDINAMKENPNKVCNSATGFCTVVCKPGWGDFDLDPSNGCEADLSGPCGKAITNEYKSPFSCGETCQDCSKTPGSYFVSGTIAYQTSYCMQILPEYYLDNPIMNKVEATVTYRDAGEPEFNKFQVHYAGVYDDYDPAKTVINPLRFGYACATESIKPTLTPAAGYFEQLGYENTLCDPRKCRDVNYVPSDGCEMAVGYSIDWANDAIDTFTDELRGFKNRGYSKATFNHWYSRNTDGENVPATTYYIRQGDGKIVLGWDNQVPTPAPDVWLKIFSFNDGKFSASNIEYPFYVETDPDDHPDMDYYLDEVRNYWFTRMRVNTVPGYFFYNWGNDIVLHTDVFPVPYDNRTATDPEYLIYKPLSSAFPYLTVYREDEQIGDAGGESSAYDCSNSMLPAPVAYQTASGKIAWSPFSTDMPGPWYHVNQSLVSSCYTGPNPGAPVSSAAGQSTPSLTNWGVNVTAACGLTGSATTSTNPSKSCYSNFVWTGVGKCRLQCENGWKDGDADPTNGCESGPDNYPYPMSRCTARYLDPLGAGYQNVGTFNYNDPTSCGAGYCLDCAKLPGVNQYSNSNYDLSLATPNGQYSSCYDGGDDWVFMDSYAALTEASGMPSAVDSTEYEEGWEDVDTRVKYPGDYYCNGVINNLACVRIQLSYACKINGQNTQCYPKDDDDNNEPDGDGITTVKADAAYVQICEDRDEIWQNGCEVALGYNIDNSTSNNVFTTLTVGLFTTTVSSVPVATSFAVQGNYKRSIGVRPVYDKYFNELVWGDPSEIDETVQGGFDCEILRKLPRYHTHVQEQVGTQNKVECSQSNGRCTMTCDTNWRDCDGNPWNGCETSTLLCGSSGTDQSSCEIPSGQPNSCGTINDSNLLSRTFARSIFCDGNQIPFDDWRQFYAVDEFLNYPFDAETPTNTISRSGDDAGYIGDQFEITDHGMLAINILTQNVDPVVSRYTIKGYWDNIDVDYVCRVWLNTTTLQPSNATLKLRDTNLYPIPADANRANGKCTFDCNAADGYYNCPSNNNVWDGCESTTARQRCSSGCIDCDFRPGMKPAPGRCINTNPQTTISITWSQAAGVLDTWTTVYGSDVEPISSEFAICDVRGQGALGPTEARCDDNLCRDYDGDWENGCEFPMNYNHTDFEVPSVLYSNNEGVIDGFDCTWVYDLQPDAGGRNYGGKTWAEFYHVDLSKGSGQCIGDSTNPNAGKCDIVCEDGWSDCDGDPTNGCENDESKCAGCYTALRYPTSSGTPTGVDCRTLNNASLGFIPNTQPTCSGRESGDGLCIHYFCNIFKGYCDSGLGDVLGNPLVGCIQQTADDAFCGADWNWRDLRSNASAYRVVPSYTISDLGIATPSYMDGQTIDYAEFDGTGRCGDCSQLSGYDNSNAYCKADAVVAGHTINKQVYYKPRASGWINNDWGQIQFAVSGNTVGDYLCELYSDVPGEDGACDRNLCVDEDYFWANGCETAVNYNTSILVYSEETGLGVAGAQRKSDDYSFTVKKRAQSGYPGEIFEEPSDGFGFDYHFAFNDANYGRFWPRNPTVNTDAYDYSQHSQIRGIWCPFLQYWSLATDNYITGGCNIFPCPHFDQVTLTSWISCVNNASDVNAGKCNFVCNADDGYHDCNQNPMDGCETDVTRDNTCGDNCERVDCNDPDRVVGLNPFYWNECVDGACDLSVCDDPTHMCKNLDDTWTNGCETATNYPDGATYNCLEIDPEDYNFAWVKPCNGEPGNHWFGKCAFECAPGFIDCDGDFSNGCEHDGSLCQDCTAALGYVTYFDGADYWEQWTDPSDINNPYFKKIYGQKLNTNKKLTYSMFNDTDATYPQLHNQFDGPEVAYAQFHRAYVAAFECSTLSIIYPGHFDDSVNITCDSHFDSPTAGLCTFACNNTAGYFDCDGDPRNGCEHMSAHETCGNNGACRNCYYMSGVDYPVSNDIDTDPVSTDLDTVNDASLYPYGDSQNSPQLPYGAFTWDSDTDLDNLRDLLNLTLPSWDVYDEPTVQYFARYSNASSFVFQAQGTVYSPLRLGCLLFPDITPSPNYQCNLKTCDFNFCDNTQDQNTPTGWLNGCSVAKKYPEAMNFEGGLFDCSLMGPDHLNNDRPRDTTDYTKPSFHVRQLVQSVGCDGKGVNTTNENHRNRGKGAWRYILMNAYLDYNTGTAAGKTEGIYAFDYEGIANLFEGTGIADFPLYRVRGDQAAGQCYFECEYGYEDCDGDPRNGCEVDITVCIDNDPSGVGWGSTGCETSLTYTDSDGLPIQVNCFSIVEDPTVTHINASAGSYCRGGQDGEPADGKCSFVCLPGWQDCDGNPINGCETEIGEGGQKRCNCVDCTKLPGTQSQADGDPADGGFAVSSSVCDRSPSGIPEEDKCSLPCNASLCADVDLDWTNGCEVALAYQDPRHPPEDLPPLTTYDCSSWAKDPLLAKKHHIDPLKLGSIYCEGRYGANGAGECVYQTACHQRSAGALFDYQDCDSDPRNGCEDTGLWCRYSAVTDTDPRGTESERCSVAMKYYCDGVFDALGRPCLNITSEVVTYPYDEFPLQPTGGWDCWNLLNSSSVYQTRVQVNLSAPVLPYCDRNAGHEATRGDCVFTCNKGYANCNGDASDGCEASTSAHSTCSTKCVNCKYLSGIDLTVATTCIEDGEDFKCDFSCGTPIVNGQTICADEDKLWETGCEVANNGDIDQDGVFMNPNQKMDCSVMQREARINPALFRHHLHIDLDSEIDLGLGNVLMPGTIFCNGGYGDSNTFGRCYFKCLEGFINGDNLSFNGCESPDPNNTYPYGTYGGYWIGDYLHESYAQFLCDVENGVYAVPLDTPIGACQAYDERTADTSTTNPNGVLEVYWY